MNKNGFVISTDSFLGLTIIAFVIIASLFYLSQINFSSWNSVYLINSARDVAIVLEKSDSFKNSVFLNSSELITEKLNATPDSKCFEVSIFGENYVDPKIVSLKPGCVKLFREKFSIDRSFVVDNNFYLAKVEVWYK